MISIFAVINQFLILFCISYLDLYARYILSRVLGSRFIWWVALSSFVCFHFPSCGVIPGFVHPASLPWLCTHCLGLYYCRVWLRRHRNRCRVEESWRKVKRFDKINFIRRESRAESLPSLSTLAYHPFCRQFFYLQ